MLRTLGLSEQILELSSKEDYIRNIGISAHIDAGKTTLSDNLLAGSGLISEEKAGKQLVLDYDQQEQARGITINAASASMVYQLNDVPYLINLIDTPGHVDFGGDVTRAMRAIDGVIVVVCGVEGIMPQTRTVVKQAMKERVKPILFINKIDRLLTELRLDHDAVMQRVGEIVVKFNTLLRRELPLDLYEKWKIFPGKGNFVFGSAFHNWAFSIDAKREGVDLGKLFELVREGKVREASDYAHLHKYLCQAIIQNVDSPLVAQKTKIPVIWKGDVKSDLGQAMLNVDPNGPVALMITKILLDQHSGLIACGRLFSGTLRKGQQVYIGSSTVPVRVQSTGIAIGNDRVNLEEIRAGNIVAVSGLLGAVAGSTVCDQPSQTLFESIHHYTDPVITKSITAKKPKDLPRLINALLSVKLCDPSINIRIDNVTGENLMSGMGELHLEITEFRIQNEYKVDIQTSQPIVVYHERVKKESPIIESKSNNRLNKFFVRVSPLTDAVRTYLHEHDDEDMPVLKRPNYIEEMVELGFPRDEARRLIEVHHDNVFVDNTKGVQYLNEVMKMLKEGFVEICEKGPYAEETVSGIKVELVDAVLHSVVQCRTAYQIIVALTHGVRGAMIEADRVLLEPIQEIEIEVPQEYANDCIKILQTRRGVLESLEERENINIILCSLPVATSFGFSSDIRSASKGHALWSGQLRGFFPVPPRLEEEIVVEIRKRKGIKEQIPVFSDFIGR